MKAQFYAHISVTVRKFFTFWKEGLLPFRYSFPANAPKSDKQLFLWIQSQKDINSVISVMEWLQAQMG